MTRRTLDESGSLLVPLIAVIVLFLGAAAFGVWAFMGRQDYKNNTDQKVAVAVTDAVKAEDIKKDAAFAEAEKSPLKTYVGPAAYGSLSFQYPKTWSAYVVQVSNGQNNLSGYMNFDVVPDITSKDVQFALKFQVVDQAYAAVLKTYSQFIQTGAIKASAFQAPKVGSVTGMKLIGNTDRTSPKKNNVLVLLPVRDKTIQIWTEGDAYLNDFNNTIMPTLTFVP